MEQRWKRYPDTAVLLETLGDSAAVFCHGTGETHIFDAFPALVLQHLAPDQSLSSEDIAVVIATMLEEEPTDWEPRVREILQAFERMQLVESVSV